MPGIVKPENGEILLVITNPNPEKIILYKETTVAMVEKVDERKDGSIFVIETETEKEKEWREEIEKVVDPTYVVDVSQAQITEEEKEEFRKVLKKYEDVFSKSKYDIGRCNAGKFGFKTTTEKPVSSKPRRVPIKLRKGLDEHIDQMVKAGLMKESDTPWVSNFTLVQKKDGSIRTAIDYRGINEVMVDDKFPLPKIDSIMEKLADSDFFSSLDCRQASMPDMAN